MRGMKTILALGFLVAAGTASAADGWLTDYNAAVKAAQERNLPILADFTGSDWCGWCQKLKAEVFDKKEFTEWAAQSVILLEVDFPKQKE
ncbi:MAG: thioredoxin family protein [Planctomycetota bacterium]